MIGENWKRFSLNLYFASVLAGGPTHAWGTNNESEIDRLMREFGAEAIPAPITYLHIPCVPKQRSAGADEREARRTTLPKCEDAVKQIAQRILDWADLFLRNYYVNRIPVRDPRTTARNPLEKYLAWQQVNDQIPVHSVSNLANRCEGNEVPRNKAIHPPRDGVARPDTAVEKPLLQSIWDLPSTDVRQYDTDDDSITFYPDSRQFKGCTYLNKGVMERAIVKGSFVAEFNRVVWEVLYGETGIVKMAKTVGTQPIASLPQLLGPSGEPVFSCHSMAEDHWKAFHLYEAIQKLIGDQIRTARTMDEDVNADRIGSRRAVGLLALSYYNIMMNDTARILQCKILAMTHAAWVKTVFAKWTTLERRLFNHLKRQCDDEARDWLREDCYTQSNYGLCQDPTPDTPPELRGGPNMNPQCLEREKATLLNACRQTGQRMGAQCFSEFEDRLGDATTNAAFQRSISDYLFCLNAGRNQSCVRRKTVQYMFEQMEIQIPFGQNKCLDLKKGLEAPIKTWENLLQTSSLPGVYFLGYLGAWRRKRKKNHEPKKSPKARFLVLGLAFLLQACPDPGDRHADLEKYRERCGSDPGEYGGSSSSSSSRSSGRTCTNVPPRGPSELPPSDPPPRGYCCAFLVDGTPNTRCRSPDPTNQITETVQDAHDAELEAMEDLATNILKYIETDPSAVRGWRGGSSSSASSQEGFSSSSGSNTEPPPADSGENTREGNGQVSGVGGGGLAGAGRDSGGARASGAISGGGSFNNRNSSSGELIDGLGAGNRNSSFGSGRIILGGNSEKSSNDALAHSEAGGSSGGSDVLGSLTDNANSEGLGAESLSASRASRISDRGNSESGGNSRSGGKNSRGSQSELDLSLIGNSAGRSVGKQASVRNRGSGQSEAGDKTFLPSKDSSRSGRGESSEDEDSVSEGNSAVSELKFGDPQVKAPLESQESGSEKTALLRNLASADPDNYFERVPKGASIFEIVHQRYQDLHGALRALRVEDLEKPK